MRFIKRSGIGLLFLFSALAAGCADDSATPNASPTVEAEPTVKNERSRPTPAPKSAPILTEPPGDDWITLSGPAFSFRAPPGSSIQHIMGTDSRVGEVRIGDITFHFDAGPYGARIANNTGAYIEGDRIWWTEMIDGRDAELGAGSDWAHVTIPFDRGGHLVISVYEPTGLEQSTLLLRVFRTLTIVDGASPFDRIYTEQFPPEGITP